MISNNNTHKDALKRFIDGFYTKEDVANLFFPTTSDQMKHEGNIVHQAGLPVKNKYTTVIGNYDPKFILGFSNHFQYKNFDLNISLDGRFGGLMYSWS